MHELQEQIHLHSDRLTAKLRPARNSNLDKNELSIPLNLKPYLREVESKRVGASSANFNCNTEVHELEQQIQLHKWPIGSQVVVSLEQPE